MSSVELAIPGFMENFLLLEYYPNRNYYVCVDKKTCGEDVLFDVWVAVDPEHEITPSNILTKIPNQNGVWINNAKNVYYERLSSVSGKSSKDLKVFPDLVNCTEVLPISMLIDRGIQEVVAYEVNDRLYKTKELAQLAKVGAKLFNQFTKEEVEKMIANKAILIEALSSI